MHASRSRAAHIALAAVLATASTLAQAFDLDDIAALRRNVASGDASFREVRTLRALDAPLVRTGTLAYRRPDFLEMSVATPRPERMVIRGNTLRLFDARGDRTLALDSEPALKGWSESLRATLAGDAASLRRYFDVRVAGDAKAWSLALVPRDAALRDRIAGIDIDGAGEALRRITVREQGGDVTVTDILPMRAASP